MRFWGKQFIRLRISWTLSPEGGNGGRDFVLEDCDELFVWRLLTIAPALYKYMRIYLWPAPRTEVLEQAVI